jgi:hypothetical protein
MLLTATFAVSSFIETAAAQDQKAKKEMKAEKKYYCSHHPDHVSDKPGKCDCGMELVEMKDMDKMPDQKTMKMDKMNGDMKKTDKDKKKMDQPADKKRRRKWDRTSDHEEKKCDL